MYDFNYIVIIFKISLFSYILNETLINIYI